MNRAFLVLSILFFVVAFAAAKEHQAPGFVLNATLSRAVGQDRGDHYTVGALSFRTEDPNIAAELSKLVDRNVTIIVQEAR